MPIGPYENFAECEADQKQKYRKAHPEWSEEQVAEAAKGTCGMMEQRAREHEREKSLDDTVVASLSFLSTIKDDSEKSLFDEVMESARKLVARIQDDMNRQTCRAAIDDMKQLVEEATVVDLTSMQKIRKKLEELIKR